jgi:hypothetical protein
MKVQQTYPEVRPAVDLEFGRDMQQEERHWSPIAFDGPNDVLISRSIEPHQVGSRETCG